MKRYIRCAGMALLFLWLTAAGVFAKELVPVGQVVGLELHNNEVTVAAIDENLGENAREAGILPGDVIQKIDNVTIHSSRDVQEALQSSGGSVTVEVLRGGKRHQLHLTPNITREGPKMGLYLRQGITGIGTVTWYDPETGTFGTLGHGVNDGRGQLLTITGGSAYSARVLSVKKGISGKPGQLMGAVTSPEERGTLIKNTPRGVFGKTEQGFLGSSIPVALSDEIHTGSAVIRSTVAGETVQEYSVEIVKIYSKDRCNGRNLLLKITDPQLLEQTGGIVQGMSGSPIIQDGKLVGAVTHVLVNDPTMGYGIFIENMLDSAE